MSIISRITAVFRREPSVQRDYGFQDWIDLFQNNWQQFAGQWPGYQMTYGKDPAEPIANDFAAYVSHGLAGNSVIWSLESKRLEIFTQVRFQYQQMRGGRPANLFGDSDLDILETPWPSGTTGDLLAKMLLDADFAGNAFLAPLDGEIVRLRPDWVEIVLAPRMLPLGPDGDDVQVGFRQVGIMYYENGINSGAKPAVFLPGEYAHFAPKPDPLASYRGMSWLTPVIRELQADTQATKHKLKFFENGATPNVVVSLPKEITPAQFEAFKKAFKAGHRGVETAYETLFVGGGADVTVVGANMQQLDFKVTQGAGETRLAAASGIHPVVAGLSEGMQGSSLNAGNFGSAKRLTVDGPIRHLWQNAAGSLAPLVPAKPGARLWYDDRDIPFLFEDKKDIAQIQQLQASAWGSLVRDGMKPDAATEFIRSNDLGVLLGQHTGLFSVQLQPPGTGQPAAGAPGDVGPKAPAARSRGVSRKFDPAELRDDRGRWTDGPGGAVAGAVKDVLKIADSIPLGDGERFEASSRVRLPNADVRMALTREADGSPSLRFGVDSQLPSKWRGMDGKYTVKLDHDGIDKLAAKTDELAKTTRDAERRADRMWAHIEEVAARLGIDINNTSRREGQSLGDPELDRLLHEYDAFTDVSVLDEGTFSTPWGQLYYRAVMSDTGAHTYLLVTKPGAKLTGNDALEDVRGYSDPAEFSPADMRKLATAMARIQDAASSKTGG